MWSISQQPHHPLLIPGTSQTSKPLITSPQACRIPARLTIHASIPSLLSLQVLQATVSPACLSPNQPHPLLCPLPQSLFTLRGTQLPERGHFSLLKHSANDLLSPKAAFSIKLMLLQNTLLGIVDLQQTPEFSLGSKGSLETEFSNTKPEPSSS